MAGHARFTAVLDACVLYPMAMCDGLISLAATGIYAAKWTRKIEMEWIASLERNRPDLQGKLTARRDAMRSAVLDWEIKEAAWQKVRLDIQLPDQNDHHVLAAAKAGNADCIVTTNLKDFPSDLLSDLEIEAIHPDQFLINQWDLDHVVAISAFKAMRARWKKPDATPIDFANAMERGGLPATADRLRQAAALI